MSKLLKPEIVERIALLEEKFKNSGQDLGSYLDGLLHDRYITYWDYIHLDTLLSLQVPSTHFPDEIIFITYHQITELYFKLVLHEINQIIECKELTAKFFIEKLVRINRYFETLSDSFDIMAKGMEKKQFLKFRMSLIPASGFQSVQFRMIELYTTPLINLVSPSNRSTIKEESSIEEVFEQLYWKFGATDTTTGEKTLTLKQFEYRYTPRLLRIANQSKGNTVLDCFNKLTSSDQKDATLLEAMRSFDTNVNINWSLAHLKAAYHHLNKKDVHVKATGGTNWKAFLPPSFQRISFFPFLWTENELADWGKDWIEDLLTSE